jgi:hypothetical protein
VLAEYIFIQKGHTRPWTYFCSDEAFLVSITNNVTGSGSHLTVVVTTEDGWADPSFLCSIQSDKNRRNTSTCGFKIVAGTSVLYCISAVTNDPNSDITRCFSTLLDQHTVFRDSVSTRCVVCGPAPLRHITPFIIECLFSLVTNSSYLWGLRFASRPRYFPVCYSVTPRKRSVSLKQASAALIFTFFRYLILHTN